MGAAMPIPEEKYRRKNPGTARFLTLIVPGLGHLYARQFLGGCITLLIVAPIHFLYLALILSFLTSPHYYRIASRYHFRTHLALIALASVIWSIVFLWLRKDAAERCVDYNMRLSLKEEKEREDAFRKNNPFGEKSLEP